MLLLCLLGASAAACDSFIFDDEGDCNPYYKVRFVYDMNMKYADAFPNEVNAVTLYAVDRASGEIVWSRHESGDALHEAGYTMDVPVDPGFYNFVAWAGDGHTTHFAVADARLHQELDCRLGRDYAADGSAHVTTDLNRLYHGRLDDVELPDEQGVHTFTVPLVKNTNVFHIVLQHLSGEPLDAEDFTYEISDANGLMGWDNALKDDEQITYHAWDKRSGTAGVELPQPEGRAPVTQVSAAIADLTTARLVKGQDMRLNIRTKADNRTVVSIPVIDYCLLVKGNYDRAMTDQEYLDRQDEYSMVFFLDANNHWLAQQIYINSWRVILNNTEI